MQQTPVFEAWTLPPQSFMPFIWMPRSLQEMVSPNTVLATGEPLNKNRLTLLSFKQQIEGERRQKGNIPTQTPHSAASSSHASTPGPVPTAVTNGPSGSRGTPAGSACTWPFLTVSGYKSPCQLLSSFRSPVSSVEFFSSLGVKQRW